MTIKEAIQALTKLVEEDGLHEDTPIFGPPDSEYGWGPAALISFDIKEVSLSEESIEKEVNDRIEFNRGWYANRHQPYEATDELREEVRSSIIYHREGDLKTCFKNNEQEKVGYKYIMMDIREQYDE